MATTVTPRTGLLPDGTAVGVYRKHEVELEREQATAPLPKPLKSGVMASGKFTATLDPGNYVLIGFVDEVQEVKVDATAGQFKLTFEGQQTANIAYNATAAKVREELEALSNLAPGDIEVTGGPGSSGGGTPYGIKFLGEYAGTNVATITAANGTTPLSGGGAAVTVTTKTQGSKAGAGGTQRYCLFTVSS
jgi:hypothetical protein